MRGARRFRLLSVAFALLLIIGWPIGARSVLVRSRHSGRISAIVLVPGARRLFSAGEDGTVKIYNSMSGALQESIQVSPHPIALLAHHPSRNRIVVVESDGVSIHLLTVWDLDGERRLYSIRLDEAPLALAYSPQGSYIVYTRADWESVVFLDADRGVELRDPDDPSSPRFEGFGIVGAFYLTPSERTFVAYLPSGSIQYRDVATGDLKSSRIATTRGLSNLSFIGENPSRAIGRTDDEIIAIDIVSGRDVAGIRVEGADIVAIDREQGEVLVAHPRGEEGGEISLYALESDQFIPRFSLYDSPPEGELSETILNERTVYFATVDGKIYRQSRFRREPALISADRSPIVHDILPGAPTLISTEDRIFTFSFDSIPGGEVSILSHSRENPLQIEARRQQEEIDSIDTEEVNTEEEEQSSEESESPPETPPEPRLEATPLPAHVGATGIRGLTNGLYLLYDRGGSAGYVGYFGPVEGLVSLLDITEPPTLDLQVRQFDVLVANGEGVTMRNLFSDRTSFEYNQRGLREVAFADDPYIVVAGQRSGVPRTTTVRVNTLTHETVSLENQNSVTFDLAYDSTTGSLFSASVDSGSSRPRTVILRHHGDNLEFADTVYVAEGEFFDATITARAGAVFFSVGGESFIRRSREAQFVEADELGAIPRYSAIYRDWVYTINRDSSISIITIAGGTHLANLYILDQSEWALISVKGELMNSSSGASAFLIDQP